MNITAILIAAAVIAVAGIIVGIGLGLFGEKFKVEVDEKEVAIREELPGNNCGGCGYAGCANLAAAIAKGEAPVNACPVGGEPVGKEIAKTLAAKGALVIVNYCGSAKRAEETVQEIEAAGGKAEAIQCDISDFTKAGEMMDYVIKTYGRVDILVNNAGITRDGLLMKMSEEDKKIAKEQILKYKEMEHLVQSGDYYRLVNPFENNNHVLWQFVSKDKKETVVCGVRLHSEANPYIYLFYPQGLDADMKYEDTATGKVYTGAALMKAGLPLPLTTGDYQPIRFTFKAVEK